MLELKFFKRLYFPRKRRRDRLSWRAVYTCPHQVLRACACLGSFIHSFQKYSWVLLPGTILGTGYPAVNKTESLPLWSFYSNWR